MKYDLVIFDLDGTLIDSINGISYSMNSVLSNNGYPTHSTDIYKQFVGHGRKELVKKALPHKDHDLKEIDYYFNEMTNIYKKNYDYKMAIYEGIVPLLDFLKDKKVKVAVNTSKDEKTSMEILARFFPDYTFTSIIGRDSTNSKKPDPEGVFFIANHNMVDVKKCIYIGDSEVDIETAKNAKIDHISVDWGFRTRRELLNGGADNIVSHPKEIMSFIERT